MRVCVGEIARQCMSKHKCVCVDLNERVSECETHRLKGSSHYVGGENVSKTKRTKGK